MFDLTSLIQQILVQAIGTGLLWLAIKRGLDRDEFERNSLKQTVTDLSEHRMVAIEDDQKQDGLKRKAIYERLEKIELTYRQTTDCVHIHQDIVRMHEQSLALGNRLERVATRAEELVKRTDLITIEQVSLGKDLADLSARMEERK